MAFTAETMRAGVNVGPDGQLRDGSCAVARTFTLVPPMSTTRTLRCVRAIGDQVCAEATDSNATMTAASRTRPKRPTPRETRVGTLMASDVTAALDLQLRQRSRQRGVH